MPRYKLLPHTADIMIMVQEETLGELFARAGEALASIVTDRRVVRKRGRKTARFVAEDLEELFFKFLKWIHYLMCVEDFLVRNVKCTFDRNGVSFECEGFGETLDEERHLIKTEVKAVTIHQLKVERSTTGYLGTFVLDV